MNISSASASTPSIIQSIVMPHIINRPLWIINTYMKYEYIHSWHTHLHPHFTYPFYIHSFSIFSGPESGEKSSHAESGPIFGEPSGVCFLSRLIPSKAWAACMACSGDWNVAMRQPWPRPHGGDGDLYGIPMGCWENDSMMDLGCTDRWKVHHNWIIIV